MLKKDELLFLLRECLDIEEKAMPVYARHLNNVLFLSDFSEEDRQKVRDILELLNKESEGHRKKFEDLISKVKGSTQDVY